MADTAVDTTTSKEVTAKELKEKKEVETEENGSGEAPANGTNGADHTEDVAEKVVEEEHKNGDATAEEEAPPAEKEEDAQPAKRAAEEQVEKVETKKQKTEENGASEEAKVEA